MRKLKHVVAAAAVALATTGMVAGTAHASPASFVMLDEKWSGTAVVRMWYNTSNGGIHGEIIAPGWSGGMEVEILRGDGAMITGAGGLGPGPINTDETFYPHIHTCGVILPNGGWFCTGTT